MKSTNRRLSWSAVLFFASSLSTRVTTTAADAAAAITMPAMASEMDSSSSEKARRFTW